MIRLLSQTKLEFLPVTQDYEYTKAMLVNNTAQIRIPEKSGISMVTRQIYNLFQEMWKKSWLFPRVKKSYHKSDIKKYQI